MRFNFYPRTHDWLVISLILLYLVPIWIFQYIPTQDGPSHLNNAQILSQYTNPTYNFQRIYELRLEPFPNWLSHAGLAVLMQVFHPLIAEKILVSLYIIGFPLSFIYFLGAVNPANRSLGLFSFVFIYNYLFMMGFYNFVFSIPLAFWTLGYFWKHRRHFTFGQASILNFLLLIIYFGHIVIYLVVLGSIAFIAAIQFISQWLSLHGDSIREHVISLSISLFSLIPTFFILINYYLKSNFATSAFRIDGRHIPSLFKQFIAMRILVSYKSYGQDAIGLVVAAVFAILFMITIIKRVSRPDFSIHFSFRFEDCILFLFLILFTLYMLLPEAFGSGGFLNERLALLSCLFLLTWFDISPSIGFISKPGTFIPRLSLKLMHPPVLIILCCLTSLTMLTGVTYSFARIQPLLQEYTSGVELIKPNTVVLPLNFSGDENDTTRVDPLLHANHYHTLTNGAINLGNYEPFVDYFPLKFKSGLDLPIYLPGMNWADVLRKHQHVLSLCSYTSMVNYLLIWNTPDEFFKTDIDLCYTQVYSNGRMKIYTPKR